MIRAFIVIFLLAGTSFVARTEEPVAGLREAGEAALKAFLPALDSPSMKATHGFATDDNLKAVTLGEPFQPQYLSEEAIAKYTSGMKVSTLLTPAANWFLPAISKGNVAALVSVLRREDGTFVEDSLGMPELARAWAAIRDTWSKDKGFAPVFVIVPSRQRFYFTVPEAMPANLTPINLVDGAASRKIYKTLTNAEEAITALRRP